MKSLILSTAYLPPVSYLRLMASHDITYIEMNENYIKQTYRNRCIIHSSAGPLTLSVPVEKGSFHKVQISKLRIDYSKRWQRLHLRALDAAYRSSAFYEFYMDDIKEIISRQHIYLVDLNEELIRHLLKLMDFEADIRRSESFSPHYTDTADLRYMLTPKGGEGKAMVEDIRYFQVFSNENGFLPDLSIIDLLFNMGRESFSLIKKK